MRNRQAEIHEARTEAVARLREATIRHESNGDEISAEIFRELHAEAVERLANTPRNHIAVGDHDPEPCVTHEPLGYTHRNDFGQCASHAPEPERYVLPASATHGPR